MRLSGCSSCAASSGNPRVALMLARMRRGVRNAQPTRRTNAHACAQRQVTAAGAYPRASAQLSQRHVARSSTAWNWSVTRRASYYVRCLLSREAEELAANAAAEAAAASTSAESQRWKMMQATQPSVAHDAAAAAALPSACPPPCLLLPPHAFHPLYCLFLELPLRVSMCSCR